jgi:hypothetical protein
VTAIDAQKTTLPMSTVRSLVMMHLSFRNRSEWWGSLAEIA